ncbi:MAG: hypothetical protein WBD55_03505 [Dehalococcoidia bacterium]
MPDPQQTEEYRQAYDAWHEQIEALHRVLLEGDRLDPPKLKGLLNREARAKDRYDIARLALLGLDSAQDDPFASKP